MNAIKLQTNDLLKADINGTLQAKMLQLAADEYLFVSASTRISVWKQAYEKLTVQTKKMLLEQVCRGISSANWRRSELSGLMFSMEYLIKDMQLKPDLKDPVKVAGIMGLSLPTRRKKALDSSTPAEDLILLLQDEDDIVQQNIIQNYALPVELIQDLVNKYIAHDPWKLRLLCNNPAVPVDILVWVFETITEHAGYGMWNGGSNTSGDYK